MAEVKEDKSLVRILELKTGKEEDKNGKEKEKVVAVCVALDEGGNPKGDKKEIDAGKLIAVNERPSLTFQDYLKTVEMILTLEELVATDEPFEVVIKETKEQATYIKRTGKYITVQTTQEQLKLVCIQDLELPVRISRHYREKIVARFTGDWRTKQVLEKKKGYYSSWLSTFGIPQEQVKNLPAEDEQEFGSKHALTIAAPYMPDCDNFLVMELGSGSHQGGFFRRIQKFNVNERTNQCFQSSDLDFSLKQNTKSDAPDLVTLFKGPSKDRALFKSPSRGRATSINLTTGAADHKTSALFSTRKELLKPAPNHNGSPASSFDGDADSLLSTATHLSQTSVLANGLHSPPASSNGNSGDSMYEVGDVVEVLQLSTKEWIPATITKLNGSGNPDVKLSNGHVVKRKSSKNIRKVSGRRRLAHRPIHMLAKLIQQAQA